MVVRLYVPLYIIFAGTLTLNSCKPRQEKESDVRALVGDRSVLGIAPDYVPENNLQPIMNMKDRRNLGWKTLAKVLRPIKIKSARENVPELEIPLWQSWYSADEFEYLFAELFNYSDNPDLKNLRDASPAAKGVVPLPKAMVDNAFINYISAVRAGNLPAWKKKNLEEHLKKFETEEDDKRLGIHENVGLTNRGTSVFSPGLLQHLLANYHVIHKKCIDSFPAGFIQNDEAPEKPENFTACFESELPENSVVIKTTWQKIGKDSSGNPLSVGIFDTSAESMKKILGTKPSPGAASKGTGSHNMTGVADPQGDKIYTLTLKDDFGTVQYRLTGLHIMSKELRHWLWVSLWWSSDPDSDFGADRPEFIDGVWRNYKMCVVSNFDESDNSPGGHYRTAKTRSLGTALTAVHHASKPHTWCSNPFIELGAGNARTNCIGCHQHAGVGFESGETFLDECPDPRRRSETPAQCEARRAQVRSKFPYHGRSKIRQNFPNDYLFSFDLPAPDLKGRIQNGIEGYQ